VIFVPNPRAIERGVRYVMGLIDWTAAAEGEPAPESAPKPAPDPRLERAKKVASELWATLSEEERQLWIEERPTKAMEAEWMERSRVRLQELETAEGDGA
jgi:hypothetical protein